MNDNSGEKGLETDHTAPFTPKKTTNVKLFNPKIKTASKAKKWDPYSTKYVLKAPPKDESGIKISNVKNPVYRAMKELSLVHVTTPGKPKKTKSQERKIYLSRSENPSKLAGGFEKLSLLKETPSKVSQESDLNDIHITREKVGIKFRALNEFLKVGQDRIKTILDQKLYNTPVNV